MTAHAVPCSAATASRITSAGGQRAKARQPCGRPCVERRLPPTRGGTKRRTSVRQCTQAGGRPVAQITVRDAPSQARKRGRVDVGRGMARQRERVGARCHDPGSIDARPRGSRPRGRRPASSRRRRRRDPKRVGEHRRRVPEPAGDVVAAAHDLVVLLGPARVGQAAMRARVGADRDARRSRSSRSSSTDIAGAVSWVGVGLRPMRAARPAPGRSLAASRPCSAASRPSRACSRPLARVDAPRPRARPGARARAVPLRPPAPQRSATTSSHQKRAPLLDVAGRRRTASTAARARRAAAPTIDRVVVVAVVEGDAPRVPGSRSADELVERARSALADDRTSSCSAKRRGETQSPSGSYARVGHAVVEQDERAALAARGAGGGAAAGTDGPERRAASPPARSRAATSRRPVSAPRFSAARVRRARCAWRRRARRARRRRRSRARARRRSLRRPPPATASRAP